MLLSSFLFLVFLAAVLSFGWFLSVALLNERRWFAVIPFAITIGVSGYTFFLNLVTYVIPFGIASWLVLFVMGVLGMGGLMGLTRRHALWMLEGGLTIRQRQILIAAALLITVASGVVALRTLFDDLWLMHLPLASTIRAGNTPVMDPTDPDYPMPYHYSPDLLTAALNRIAGVPLWLGYDIQSILFAAAVFLAAFVLALEFTRRFSSALLGSVFVLYGSGLTWFAGFGGLKTIFETYVFGIPHAAPWKFLAIMTTTIFDSSVAITSLSHSVAMGIPVMLIMLFTFFRAIKPEEDHWVRFALVSGIAFGFLALTLETHFVILGVALALWGVGNLLRDYLKGKVSEFRRMLMTLLLILGIGSVLAIFQGGILSNMGHGDQPSPFQLVRDFWHTGMSDKGVLPSQFQFFEDFGLPLLLFFPALYYFRRDRRIVLIGGAAMLAFLIPFFIQYAPRPREIERFFGLATPLFAFIVGMFLGEVWAKARSLSSRFVVIALVIGVIFTTALFQITYSVFPLGYIGKFGLPFFAIPESPPALDAEAYGWIREHTTIQDRFFPVSDEFIRETGRFTPGEYLVGWGHKRTIQRYREALRDCDQTAFRDLGIHYLYVSPRSPTDTFEKSCLPKLGADLVYSNGDASAYRKLYRMPE